MPPSPETGRHRDRHGRAHHAATLVPLALVSCAWTTFLLAGSTASSDARAFPPTQVSPPAAPIEAPASLAAVRQPGVAGPTTSVVSDGIPAVALAAYQRAAAVVDTADPGCHLDWQLLAAIGRVESDHGRHAGGTLSADGAARPPLFGPVLDGRHGTSRISDTDGGVLDRNLQVDRAVGPMQFLPSTWLVVGVDADGDHQRNPQDIDDAALAAAVYLCSGPADLATARGAESAVYRYNHSTAYVDLVTRIARDYAVAGYASRAASAYPPLLPFLGYDAPPARHRHPAHAAGASTAEAQSSAAPTSTTTHDSGSGPKSSEPSAPQPKGDPVGQVTAPALTAAAYCQDQVSQARLGKLGGLEACVEAFADGGASAVTALLTQPLPNLLIPTP